MTKNNDKKEIVLFKNCTEAKNFIKCFYRDFCERLPDFGTLSYDEAEKNRKI